MLRDRYEHDGVLRIPGVIAPDEVRVMRDCVRERIAALELVEIAGAMRPARGTELAMWAIGREPAFAPLPDALARATAQVFGPGAWAQVEGELGGVAMPNLPCPGATWSACEVAWHVDEPTPTGRTPGRVLIGYAFLDVVEPGGGATVVIAGSHRRLAALADELATPITHDAALAAFTRAEPTFARGVLCDGSLRVVELTGEPGDLVLLEPRCLHTLSSNVSARARLVMRVTCVRV